MATEIISPNLGPYPDLPSIEALLANPVADFSPPGIAPQPLVDVLGHFVAPGSRLELTTVDTGCSITTSSITFDAFVIDAKGIRTALLRYEITPTGPSPSIHLIWVQKATSSKPSPRPHLLRALNVGVGSKFARIKLEAGLRAGPTYWAEAGFDFREATVPAHMNEVIEYLTGMYSSAPHITTAHSAYTLKLANFSIAEAYNASRKVDTSFTGDYQLDGMRASPHLKVKVDDPRPVGHALLYALSPWDAELNLGDKTAVSFYRKFLLRP